MQLLTGVYITLKYIMEKLLLTLTNLGAITTRYIGCPKSSRNFVSNM